MELLTDISSQNLCLQLKKDHETVYGIPPSIWHLAVMCNRKRKDAKVQLLSVSGEEDAKEKEVLGVKDAKVKLPSVSGEDEEEGEGEGEDDGEGEDTEDKGKDEGEDEEEGEVDKFGERAHP